MEVLLTSFIYVVMAQISSLWRKIQLHRRMVCVQMEKKVVLQGWSLLCLVALPHCFFPPREVLSRAKSQSSDGLVAPQSFFLVYIT